MFRINAFGIALWLFSLLMGQGIVRAGDEHLMISMRDGKKLSAYLFAPEGKGPWPVLYEQRYADIKSPAVRKSYEKLINAGYVVVVQNFRGSHLSEGTWVGYRALGWGELKDGYDTVEWLAKQPFSTGKIGTLGSSQAGFAQNFLAVTQPPHLVCQYMIDTGLSLFHEGYRIGGTTRPTRFKTMNTVPGNPEDNMQLLKEWFKHPTYDAYWADEDCSKHFSKMNVPCFTVGSWYDFMSVGSIDSYVGRQHQGGPNSKGAQQLLIGPWLHGRFKETNKTNEMVYPDNSKFFMDDHMIRWFDHYLKGAANGVEKDVAVKYYVMGAVGEKDAPGNVWKESADWPLKSIPTSYYLSAGGKLGLNPTTIKSSKTDFIADPINPATIPAKGFPGGIDARVFESQAQVKTFTTEILDAPVEWTGKVQAEMFLSSDALDTDLIVRVSDVYPDGRSMLIIDYVRRLRYREGYEKEVFLEKGKVAKVAFDVGSLSMKFNKGHKIRVTIASTGAPFYEPNPNNGEPLTVDFPANAKIANNSIHHEIGFQSKIIAPLIK